MSSIRERQIKEILDMDNFFKRIVLQRSKASVKDYSENRKEPQILDNKIIDNNKTDVNSFLARISKFNSFLRSIVENPEPNTYNMGNSDSYPLQKILNLSSNFNIWQKLMEEYVSVKTNLAMRTNILNNLQKLIPYLEPLIKNLEKEIIKLSYVYASRIKNVIYDEYGENEQEILPIETSFKIFYDYDYDINRYDTDDDENGFANADAYKIKRLKNVNAKHFLPLMIENLAFYKCVHYAITKDQLKPLEKSVMAYEISQILNDIYTKSNYAGKGIVINKISDDIKGFDLPELTPYFRAGFPTFKKYFDELDALRGANLYPDVEGMLNYEGPPVPDNDNNDDNDDNDDNDYGDGGYVPVAPVIPIDYEEPLDGDGARASSPPLPRAVALPGVAYQGYTAPVRRATRTDRLIGQLDEPVDEETKGDDASRGAINRTGDVITYNPGAIYRRNQGRGKGKVRKSRIEYTRAPKKTYIKNSKNPMNFNDENNDLFDD